MKTLVVLIGGGGSNLQAIIDRIADCTLNGRIAAVISHNENAYGLERAKNANIPALTILRREYETTADYESALIQSIEQHQDTLIVLAGFMKILSETFVNHFKGRIINIHPSLLPKHKGLDTHRKAIEAGDTQHGVSVHYVSPELDSGAIIARSVLDIRIEDTPESLKERVLRLEHNLYPQVINWILNNELQLKEDRAYLKGTLIPSEGLNIDCDLQRKGIL